MKDRALAGCRVLVAEDEYLLASDAASALEEAGATVVGPIGTLEQARQRIDRERFDVAVLDIRLAQDLIYPVADLIREMGVPLLFLSGYDRYALPARFADVPLCPKPCRDELLLDMVRALWTPPAA